MKTFSDDQLDEAEALLKRERPDLWRRLTQPLLRGRADSGFSYEFLQFTKRLPFMLELNDSTSLSYRLYGRAIKQEQGDLR